MRKAPKKPLPMVLAQPPETGLAVPIGFETLVEAFFRGKDEETVRSYKQRLTNFASFLKVEAYPDAARIFLSQGHGQANLVALNFQHHLLKDREFSPNYVAGHLTALNSMVKLARTLGLVPWTLELQRVKPELYRDTRGPGTTAVGKVIEDLASKTDPISVRDRAIIVILYQCCARRGDLVGLDLEHVDFLNHRVWAKRKKKSERTEMELHADGERVLREWIKVRGDHPGPLFLNFDPAKKGSGRLSGMGIVRICHKYGLGKPHGLRHTGTTDALEATGGNITEVMKRTGHKDPKTVMIYNDNRLRTAASTSEKIADLMKRKMSSEKP